MHDKKIDGGYSLIVEPSGKKKNMINQLAVFHTPAALDVGDHRGNTSAAPVAADSMHRCISDARGGPTTPTPQPTQKRSQPPLAAPGTAL